MAVYFIQEGDDGLINLSKIARPRMLHLHPARGREDRGSVPMNAPLDILSVTTSCLELLRGLPNGERRRVLSALTAVVDLTEEPKPFAPLQPIVDVVDGLHSPHFACAPEDANGVLYHASPSSPAGTTP